MKTAIQKTPVWRDHQLRFHDLRHIAISRMILAGMPICQVSYIAGHAGPHVTLSIYAHVFQARETGDTSAVRLFDPAQHAPKPAETQVQGEELPYTMRPPYKG